MNQAQSFWTAFEVLVWARLFPAISVAHVNRKQRTVAVRPRLARGRRLSSSFSGKNVASVKTDVESKQRWALALLLAACTFAVYFPVLSHPFVNYDDSDYVTANPHVQQGLTWATLVWAASSTEHSNWHPVTWLSHALDCELFGLAPAGHHFSSLLLHAINAALSFLFLASVTAKTWRCLFVAALFALHPINVESVAWVAERKTVLSMFLLLLTLTAYAWYARQPKTGRYACVVACFSVGLAAKPMIVTLPFLLLLLDYWPWQRVKGMDAVPRALGAPQRTWARLALEKLPLFMLSAASCVATVIAQRASLLSPEILPLSLRLTNAIHSYVIYLCKALWPHPLAVYYPRGNFTLASWETLLSLSLLIGLSAAVWRLGSRGYLLTGWFWFLGTLVPMIGLVQAGNQAMADRYAYLPLIGIFIAITWEIAEFVTRRHIDPKLCTIAGVIVLVVFSWATSRQLRVWNSSVDLWSHALAVTRDNYVAHDNLAYELLSLGRPAEALHHFQEAASLSSADPLSHWALAASLEDQGRFREAAHDYEVVIRYPANPRQLASACLSTAVISSELGDYLKASEYARTAVQTDPQTVAAIVLDAERSAVQTPSADNYLRMGLLLELAGQIPKATEAYQQAIELDPNSAMGRRLLDHIQATRPGA